MVGLVEGRTDERRHAAVENDEFLSNPLFHIYHAAYERSALAHDRPSELEMELLAGTEPEIVSEHLEI